MENRRPRLKKIVRSLYDFKGLRFLHQSGILGRKNVIEAWPIEQGALALACIDAGVRIRYLDETYNSWGGDDDFHILHCFKSLYQSDRRSMYSEESESWIDAYLQSEIPGLNFLAGTVREYKQTFGRSDR